METQFVCPNCGCKIATAEHTQEVRGIAIGKDANLGTIALPREEGSSNSAPNRKPKSAMERLALLKAANIPGVDSMMAMPNGHIGRWNDDGCSITTIDESDPIIAKIMNAGSLRHAHLFRQHMMKQMFDILVETKTHWHGSIIGYTVTYYFDPAKMNVRYNYHLKSYKQSILNQFMLLHNEVYRLNAMQKSNDNLNLKLNLRAWFPNGSVEIIEDMCDIYMQLLYEHVSKLKVRNCKGREYVRPMGRRTAQRWGFEKYKGCFVDELEEKFYGLYKNLFAKMIAAASVGNFKELHHILFFFLDVAIKKYDTGSAKFRDAYKFCGAFWTMQNMIDFHNCTFIFRNDDERDSFEPSGEPGTHMTRQQSKEYLLAASEAHQGEGWMMFGLMKRLITESKFDPIAFIKMCAENYKNKKK